VAAMLAQGRSNSAIAAALRISTHTARHHTQRVLAKLGVHSRAQAGAKVRG
jgi:DNA-binding CsgD family transcriptional regulator